MSVLRPDSLRQVVEARRAYFDQGILPSAVIDEAVFRSWLRCVASDKREIDDVVYEPVGRSRLHGLLEANQALLAAAASHLERLTQAVSGAGYAVLLTDRAGCALAVSGALASDNRLMRAAFRPGVNLGEEVIGTNAMSCAMQERQAIRVFGPEHFYAANQIFHCAAAPVFGPDGSLLGAIDITRDNPKPDLGALSLVTQCAQAIERELFKRLPAHLTLDLSWNTDAAPGLQDLILAFGADGEILALNENARKFVNFKPHYGTLEFEDIFDGRFEDLAGPLRQSQAPIPLRLRSGLCLFASARNFHPAAAIAARPARKAEPAAPLPEFGDPAIERQLATSRRALASGLPVLVLGETGTGKEVVARALHAHGARAAGRFVAINCAAIPDSLIEGELFGHVEGAYTGARRGGAQGKIEMADGGTLFLDEIGDMPVALQTRLLRVIETREVCRLGTGAGRTVDFQLICATHQDIARAVADGRFRQDLYYRINGCTLSLPPLRARSGFARLVDTLLAEISGATRAIAGETVQRLAERPWPGNIRELKHALTYAHAMAEPGAALQMQHFPPELPAPAGAPAPRRSVARGGAARERDAIRAAMERAGGRVEDAAKLLGISRATLYRRLKAG